MTDGDRGFTAIEVPHFARAYLSGSNCETRRAALYESKVDEFGERALEWCRRIESGSIFSQRIVRAQKGQGVGLEKPRYSTKERGPVRGCVGEPRPGGKSPEFLASHAAPEFLHPVD